MSNLSNDLDLLVAVVPSETDSLTWALTALEDGEYLSGMISKPAKLTEYSPVYISADLKNGFFFVEFSGGKSLQCCLMYCEIQEKYLLSIDSQNSGFADGVCRDVNLWCFIRSSDGLYDNFDYAQHYLFVIARRYGVKVL